MRREGNDSDFVSAWTVMPEHTVRGGPVLLGVRLKNLFPIRSFKRSELMRLKAGMPWIRQELKRLIDSLDPGSHRFVLTKQGKLFVESDSGQDLKHVYFSFEMYVLTLPSAESLSPLITESKALGFL